MPTDKPTARAAEEARPERLRVMRIIARLNVGGPALHVGLLTARLDPDRFESILAAGTPGAGEGSMLDLRPALAADIGDRLTTIEGLGRDVRGVGDAKALIGLARLARSFRPHIVHTHTAKAGALGRVVAKTLRVPVVVHTFHGTVFSGHFGSAAGSAVAASERALGALADALLAVSPSVAADLRARGIGGGAGWRVPRLARRESDRRRDGERGRERDKVRVVPLGLDLAPLASVPALEANAPPVLTLVARLAPVKDVPLFIAAAAIARDRVPGLEVRIAGDGPMRGDLERSAPKWVEFLGFQSDMAGVLAATTAVALSSRSEGSPVALIEALAAGRPVAAVPVGGVPDVLHGRGGAVLATDRSPGALAEAMVDALTNRARRTAAVAERTDLAEKYGIERLLSDISSLYDELWDSRVPRTRLR